MTQNKKSVPFWKYLVLVVVIICVIAVALMALALYTHASNLKVIVAGLIGLIILRLIFKYIIK